MSKIILSSSDIKKAIAVYLSRYYDLSVDKVELYCDHAEAEYYEEGEAVNEC